MYIILKDGTRTDKCLACGRVWESKFISKGKERLLTHTSKGLCRGCHRKGEYKELELAPKSVNWRNDLIPSDLQDLLLENAFDVYKLSHGSIKEIKHKCDICQKEKLTPFKLFVQHKNLAHPQCKSTKTKQTNSKKYGYENHLTSPIYKEQTKQKMLERFGVENIRQHPSHRNKLNQWCEENPDKLFTSKGEQEVLDWIRSYYPSAKKHKQDGHEIDIFIPEINLGIEYNGLYWHSAAGLSRKDHNVRTYHLEKTKYYEQHNIRIIHVWEHEWKNRPHQTQSFILSAIGKNTVKLNPRNCNIIWSDSKDEIKKAHELLDNYHIQGHVNSTKYVANVYYQDELIATATFGKHHRGLDQWVLSRFCAKMNYTVRGLLGKVSKLAYSKLNQPLVSWADYRLSQGNGYLKAGWKLEETLPPDYFYFKASTFEVVSKQSRQKQVIKTPEEMTEYEHALLDGLERVWDCGKIRFLYKG